MKDRPDGDRLGEIVEIMLDAFAQLLLPSASMAKICRSKWSSPAFSSWTAATSKYVFHAMKECPSNIRNIRAYLLTTLYNAPATMDNFYSAKVNHDFNGW